MKRISTYLKHGILLPLCMLFIFTGAITVHAATYYVATTGNDSNPGTVTQPFRSIARGLSLLEAGDKLYIRAGTYTEGINSVPSGTSWADAPLISAYPGETVTLKLPSTSTGGFHIYFDSSNIQYVVFSGLVLDGGYQNIRVLGTAHHVKFENLEIKNGFHQCVAWGVSTHHLWFTGGRVHHCGLFETPNTASGYSFYISGTDQLIEHVVADNNKSYCMHIYDSNYRPQRVTVRNSTFHHCSLALPYTAAILAKGDNHLIYNNLVYSNSGHGIMTYGATDAKFLNNTVYNNVATGLYVYPGSTNTDVRNNISYANKAGEILDSGTGTILSKNLTSDPRFVSAAAFDFKLQTSSPAIDAGVTLSQVTTDIKKTPRPQGETHDIGAYEAGTGSDSESPAPPTNLTVN